MEHVVFDGAEVMVGEPQLLQSKMSAVRFEGPAKLQVIADFDATLTKYRINGQRGQSSHGILQQGNPEYDLKRQKLYEYYHPLEIDPTIPLDDKAKLMEEWWEKTHGLLIEGGLTYDAIKSSVANSKIAFREGVIELFELLEKSNVPVLIFSAGLADIIEEVLRQKLHRSFNNVKIVSNRMVFDQNGNLVSFKGKLIHVLNKNEHAIDMAGPVHDHLGDVNGMPADATSVKMRTNVLLLGDHIGDLGMSDGLNYNTRISMGFLNDNIESSRDTYRKSFDVVYMNDAPMWGVVKLASQLCSTVTAAIIKIIEKPWERIYVDGQPHEHGFKFGSEKHTTEVTVKKSGAVQVISGIEGLALLKTTKSGFEGFIKDKHTMLPETRERMLATEVTSSWRYTFETIASIPAKKFYFAERYMDVKKVMVESFFGPPREGVYSPSVQSTL